MKLRNLFTVSNTMPQKNGINLVSGQEYTADRPAWVYFGAVGNVDTGNASFTKNGVKIVENSSGLPDWQFQARNNCLFIPIDVGDTYQAIFNENCIVQLFYCKGN